MEEAVRLGVATLGRDPEQAHLPPDKRKLKGVSWYTLESMKNDKQVSQAIKALIKLEDVTRRVD